MENKPERRKRQTKKQNRDLIAKHNICFEGPLSGSKWPDQYVSIFTTIRQIERVNYEDYYSEMKLCVETQKRSQMNKTIRATNELMNEADQCRKTDANERDWRSATERLVLKRFMEDISCSRCEGRQWKAEFQAEPTCERASSQLSHLRSSRLMCTCNEKEFGLETQSPYSDGRRIFAGIHEPSISDPMIPADGRRNPDYVLGLLRGENSPLSRALEIPAEISCTPLDTGDHVLFPFLILEAKSGEYCSDFSAIEKQTAFPIRKLVNFQNLMARTTEEGCYHPLVWFVAFRGEDWKIHGCIPTCGGGIRIIQLWNGDIRRADCALQLFLIVDMICDWAADIYLKGVISWMSDALSAVPDGSDTDSEDWSDAKSQLGELLGEQDTMGVLDDPGHNTDTVTPYSPAESPPLPPMPGGLALDWDMAPIPPPIGGNSVTRKVDEISFSFHHLTLPESTEELVAFLSVSGPQSEDIAQNAAKLLGLFNLRSSILVTGNFVSKLEEFWTENSDTRSHPMLNHDELMLADISFRLHAPPDVSFSFRDLSCIIASANAISTLHAIAGKKRSILIGDQRCDLQNLDILTPLKKLSSSESFHTASRTTFLSLCVTKDPSDSTPFFSWTQDGPRGEYISGLWQNLETATAEALFSPILGSSQASYKMASYDNDLLRSSSLE